MTAEQVRKQPVAPYLQSPSRPLADREPRRRRIVWSPAGVIGVGLVFLLVLVAVLGPVVISADPGKQDLLDRLAEPYLFGGRANHLLGTDGLGRDLFARVVAGARVSLIVGVVATLVAGVIGVALGLIAGYMGGAVDAAVSFLVDVQLTLPFVVVGIAVVAVLGNSLNNVILVLAITGWVAYARIVRLQTRSLRNAPFIDAARAIGVGPGRVIWRHMLPNIAGPIIVIASQQVAAMILYEAALSYLGLGVPSSRITWGGMIADGRQTMLTAWWVSTIPGLAIALTVLGFNLLGDWLRDRFDPVTRSRRSWARF
ncbi:MAG: ABC transporter permease [Thermomicrobiales bacterium]